MLQGNILITGGAGTLGKAIIGRAFREQWNCKFTVFSRDAAKHIVLKNMFPDVTCVIGDIRDFTTLYNVMAGHDLVIHAAAVKRIPESEKDSIETYEINVGGSLNVAMTAVQLNIPRVIAISTDKACHACNAYGATKYLMEKVWQEYARYGFPTKFHLVRYGNVIESNGSVVEAWRKALRAKEPLRITNPAMTRFWLSPDQAVDLVLKAMELPSGNIYVAKMPALSIGKLAQYTVGDTEGMSTKSDELPGSLLGNISVEYIPTRPGEKMHETLLTIEETEFATDCGDHYELRPTTSRRNENNTLKPYSSDIAKELTYDEFLKLF